jgi:hypothetical protein
MIKLTKQHIGLTGKIFAIDKKFYSDNFFTKDDIARMILGKSANKIYVDSLKPTAYIIIFKMPSGAHYVTSLAGAKRARKKLLLTFVESVQLKTKKYRIYTHGKEKWGMDIFRECGFKKKGRGVHADEEVEFGDDITKLLVYEI